MGSAGAHREQAGRGRFEGQLTVAVGDGELRRGHASLTVSRSERPSL